jgi:hypothetical protein
MTTEERPLSKDIMPIVAIILLGTFGGIYMFGNVGMLDYYVENRFNCEKLESLINNPFERLHVSLDVQEIREIYRDNGCMKTNGR